MRKWSQTETDFQSLRLKMQEEPHPEQLQYEMGIDQAGRGPVLGPLVYCAFWWPLKYKQQLELMGFNDSKQLKQQDRDHLFQKLQLLKDTKCIGFSIREISPIAISTIMNAETNQIHRNLNQISLQAACQACRQGFKQKSKITGLYVDIVGPAQEYKNALNSCVNDLKPQNLTIVVESKADATYKVVGAASICAKVTRDRALKNWKIKQRKQFKLQWGSGYPSDPYTKQWLAQNKHKVFGFPTLVRFSWATVQNLLQGFIVCKPYSLLADQYSKTSYKAKTLSKNFQSKSSTFLKESPLTNLQYIRNGSNFGKDILFFLP